MRRALYRAARILGDLHAVERGRLPQRLARRVIYRHCGRLAGWLSRVLRVS